jgi:hypothetical protein
MLSAEGFCSEAGFFLSKWLACTQSSILKIARTVLLTCSGVKGLGGRLPECVARSGVDGRSAMLDSLLWQFGWKYRQRSGLLEEEDHSVVNCLSEQQN